MRKLLAGSLLVVGLAVTSIVVATLDPVGAVARPSARRATTPRSDARF